MYKCKHFVIKELVHPDILAAIGEDKCWVLLDEHALKGIDRIRGKYGKTTINTAGMNDCGLRKIDSSTGAKYSAHKFGCGFDLHLAMIENKAAEIKDAAERKKFKIKEYNKVRETLMLMPEFDMFNFEHNISWLHVDTFNRPSRLFNP